MYCPEAPCGGCCDPLLNTFKVWKKCDYSAELFFFQSDEIGYSPEAGSVGGLLGRDFVLHW